HPVGGALEILPLLDEAARERPGTAAGIVLALDEQHVQRTVTQGEHGEVDGAVDPGAGLGGGVHAPRAGTVQGSATASARRLRDAPRPPGRSSPVEPILDHCSKRLTSVLEPAGDHWSSQRPRFSGRCSAATMRTVPEVERITIDSVTMRWCW